MAQVFAGFICGAILAVALTPLLAIFLVRMRATSPALERILPAGVPAVSIGVLVHAGLFFFWTAVGMLLGLVLLAMEDAAGIAGSRNGAYTLFVAALTLMLATPIVALVRNARTVIALLALVVVAVFGWLMPYMAEWSRFD